MAKPSKHVDVKIMVGVLGVDWKERPIEWYAEHVQDKARMIIAASDGQKGELAGVGGCSKSKNGVWHVVVQPNDYRVR